MEKKYYYGIYNSDGLITHCIDTKNWIILDIFNTKIINIENQNAQEVLSILLNTNKEISILEISDKLGYSDRTIRRTFDKLCNLLGKEVLPPTKGKPKKIHHRYSIIDMKKYAFYYEKIETMRNGNTSEYSSELIDIVNREEYSYQIDELLEIYQICGLVGGPGFGKTTLALKYAQNKKYKYKIYKLDCDSLNSLTHSLEIQTSLDNCLNIEDRIYSSICNIILSNKQNRLLFIFDNISYDDSHQNIKNIEQMVQELMNKVNTNFKQNVDILYTARFEKRKIYEINIEDFTEKEAYEFLTNHIDFEFNENTIKNIIHKNKLPIYLNTIKTLAIEENSYERINDDYSEIPPSNLKIILEEIFNKYKQTKSGQHLIDLLKICSMCSNEIDIEFIKHVCEKLGLGNDNIVNVKMEFDRKCSLFKFEKNSFILHRTYQDVIRIDLMNQDERNKIMNAMIEVLSEKIKCNHYFSSQQLEKYINILHHLYEKYMIEEKHLMNHLKFLELISYAIHYYGTYYGPKNVYYLNYTKIINDMSCVGNQFQYKLYIKLLTKFNELMIQTQNTIDRKQLLIELNTYESIINDNFNKDYLIILKIRFYMTKATILRLSDINDEAIQSYQQLLQISKELNSFETLIYVNQHNAMSCVYIGDIYRRNREFSKAQEYYQKALAYTEESAASKLLVGENYGLEMRYCIGFIYNNLGMSLLEQNTSIACLNEGFEFLEKSIKIYNDLKLYKSVSIEIANLSLYYEKYAIQLKGKDKVQKFEENLRCAKTYLECSLLIQNKYLNYVSPLDYIYYYQHLYLILYLWAAHPNPSNIMNHYSITLINELNSVLNEDEIKKLEVKDFRNMTDVFSLMEEGRKFLNEALRYNLKIESLNFDSSINTLIKNSYYPGNTILLMRYYGISYRRQAECNHNNRDYALAISYFEKVVEMANELKNNGQKAFAYRELLIVYMKTDIHKFKELLMSEEVNQTFHQLSTNDELYKWFKTINIS